MLVDSNINMLCHVSSRVYFERHNTFKRHYLANHLVCLEYEMNDVSGLFGVVLDVS